MRLIGANLEPSTSASDQLPGKKNYYIGWDKSNWAEGVPLYGRIQEHEVYPGIDMVFRGVDKQLEFDFLVNPGADPHQIKLAFSGVGHSQVNSSGDLIVSSPAGNLEIHQPVAYQEMPDGSRKLVTARFKRRHNGEVSLALGSYDRRRQLVIDPSVVVYATFLGGEALDEGLGIAVSGGTTYVTGATASPHFPNTGGGFSYAGGLDVFVTAFNAAGQLVFSSIVGGSDDDVGTSIAIGDVIFVTGYTKSDDFPAFYDSCGNMGLPSCLPVQLGMKCGTQSAILLEFETTGLYNYLTASGYLGGSDIDTGLAVTADTAYGTGSSYVYVAGQTTSPDFVSCNALANESQINMGHGSGPSDAFVVKINESFGGLWFSTFLGGSNQDFATGIALDKPSSAQTNIYVTGGTVSPDFYTSAGTFQPTCGTDGNCNDGQDDAFLTKLCTFAQAPCHAPSGGVTYVYSTFLGGSGKDDAYSVAADSNGDAYITGQTASADFKLQNPFQGTLNGTQNAFVSKLNPSGTALLFSTYLGGSQSDTGLGIAVDPQTNVYLTGRTNSPNFPLSSPTQSARGGGTDAFVSVFDPTGSSLTFSTYLGGSGDEDTFGGSVAVDSLQNVYVTGDTNSTNFPTQNPYQGTIQSTENCTINGIQVLCPDAFVAKINIQSPTEATLTVGITGPGGSNPNDSVTSAPAGIDCSDNPNQPGSCAANFTLESIVTLTATPDGSQFGGWSGEGTANCGTNLTCQIQINGNMSVNATFNQLGQVYTLMVSGQSITGVLPGSGVITSTPAGIDCGDEGDICSFQFVAGTQVTLTPTPDPGSYFYGWSNNLACVGTGLCVLLMNSNQTVDYTWASSSGPAPQPDFTLTITPQSLGTISAGGQGIAGIAIATVNGFIDTVNMSCSVLPASASSPVCSVNPSSLDIPLNGAGSATLAVNTTGLMARNGKHTSAALAFSFPFLGLFGLGVKVRSSHGIQRYLKVLLCGVLLTLICFELACGTSGGGNSGGVAQPGTYTVVVNAQGASTQITHTAQVTVTVQ